MTKKDYELIASVINIPNAIRRTKEGLANDFANTLASKNPRFDKQKFLRACGVDTNVIILDRDDIRNKDTKYIKTPWADR